MITEFDGSRINDVMSIWLETTITAHSFIKEQYWQNNYDIVKNEYLPISKTYVYEEDGMIKAFISVIDDSFIGALFVLKKHQGQGIGKNLLDHCKALYAQLELCVYSENEQAVRFYKNNGFTIISEQPNEDSGVMEYTMSWSKI